MDQSRFTIDCQYQRLEYPVLRDLVQKFNADGSVLYLDRKFQGIMEWKEGMDDVIKKFRISLSGRQPLEDDDFWIIRATNEYTLEMSSKLKMANALADIIQKISKGVHRSVNAIEVYDDFKQKQLKHLWENGKNDNI